jgi:hypothetical protein
VIRKISVLKIVSSHRLTVRESRPGLLPDQHALAGLLAFASLPRSFMPTLPDLIAYPPMQGGGGQDGGRRRGSGPGSEIRVTGALARTFMTGASMRNHTHTTPMPEEHFTPGWAEPTDAFTAHLPERTRPPPSVARVRLDHCVPSVSAARETSTEVQPMPRPSA